LVGDWSIGFKRSFGKMDLSTPDTFKAKVQKRALPGVLVFTLDGELRYINREGRKVLSDLPPLPPSEGALIKSLMANKIL